MTATIELDPEDKGFLILTIGGLASRIGIGAGAGHEIQDRLRLAAGLKERPNVPTHPANPIGTAHPVTYCPTLSRKLSVHYFTLDDLKEDDDAA